MPKKQGSHGKTGYILTAKERYKMVWLSRGDHYGAQWWAKQQNITLTEALHDMIHEFMGKRLEAYKQKGIEDALLERKISPSLFQKLRRIPLRRRKRP